MMKLTDSEKNKIEKEEDLLPEGSTLAMSDSRIIVWELSRPLLEDKDVVSFSPGLTAAVGCNTAVYPLGNVEQAKATM